MIDLANFVLHAIGAYLLIVATIAYARVAWLARGTVFHLTFSVVLLSLAYVSRSTYWDALPTALGPRVWSAWMLLSGGSSANMLPNALAIWGGIHSQFALLGMIPDDERGAWRWWSAAWYPPVASVRWASRLRMAPAAGITFFASCGLLGFGLIALILLLK